MIISKGWVIFTLATCAGSACRTAPTAARPFAAIAALVLQETAKWARVVKESGAQAE
jgi:hypothetical protein